MPPHGITYATSRARSSPQRLPPPWQATDQRHALLPSGHRPSRLRPVAAGPSFARSLVRLPSGPDGDRTEQPCHRRSASIFSVCTRRTRLHGAENLAAVKLSAYNRTVNSVPYQGERGPGWPLSRALCLRAGHRTARLLAVGRAVPGGEGAVLPFRGGASPAETSAGWSGKGEALPVALSHQVDWRQQVGGEPATARSMATPSGRVIPLVVQPAAAWPGQAAAPPQCGHEAEERATRGGRHDGGDQLVALAPCRGGPQDRIPAIQPSPLATGPKMISHGAHASQRRLSGGGAPASAAMAAGSPTLSRRVRTVGRVVGIEPVPPLFDVLVHVGEDLLPPGGVDALQRCVQLRQIAPDELVGLAGGLS